MVRAQRRVASLEVIMGGILDTRGSAFDVLLQKLRLLMHDDRCMALRGGSVTRNGMTS